MIKIGKILFPTDFSPCAEHALQYALSFASEHRAKLYVMHVITDINAPTVFGLEVYPVLKNYEKIEEEAKNAIQRLIPEQFLKKIEVENIIVQGTPFVEIIKCAKKYDVDLITLATHGRTGITHMLIGSTAEKVVRMAPCPVLTVKHPEHEFVLP